MTAPGSPVPDEVCQELRRVVGRWRQLPFDHALSRLPAVREVVQRLADAAADASALPRATVPDLGPAVLMDQLTVLVHDACAAGAGAGADHLDVLGELSSLRRSLASPPRTDAPLRTDARR